MELIKNLKETSIVKNLFIAICGTIILAVSAKVKIPFYPVPMTMQTLVVLIIGVGFGWKLGVATISLYLFEGIIGLPVFSGTPEKGIGLVYFTGPTMGYLLYGVGSSKSEIIDKLNDTSYINYLMSNTTNVFLPL